MIGLFLLGRLGCASADPPPRAAPPVENGRTVAIFAGGCFWCMEHDFEQLEGVLEAESGYTGGTTPRPTYQQVSAGKTQHLESVRVIYDPSRLRYRDLVRYFFRHIDPTQTDGQFCDRGQQYTTAIFVADDEERTVAIEEKRAAEAELGQTVVTPIRDAGTFWLAEAYHQDYAERNPASYWRYRRGCGRDARVRALWRRRETP